MIDRAKYTRAFWEQTRAQLRPEGRAFINGAYVPARSGRTFNKATPIDGQKIADIADCDRDDIDAAVAAARAAFNDGRWRKLDPSKRKKILLDFAARVRDHAEELALLETLDVGKAALNSLDVDVRLAADCLSYYAEFADKLFDEVAPTGPNDVALIKREPLGVIGAIVPWNYPLIITAWKIGPALVAGNSVVLKPAEQSPLSAIRLGKLAKDAGLPDGILNIVPGFGDRAGEPLARHADVDMISFTGSTEVGKLMLRYAGESNLKRVALECGGKSPHIVMADADLKAAAEGIAWGIYYNQGETCHAGTRVIAHAAIRAALVEEIKRVTAGITLGHPFESTTWIGALIDEKHMQRVLRYIDIGREEGAHVALGGARALQETGGYYVEATILENVKNSMRVAQEEIFGPVLCVIDFNTEDEALTMANDSPYGLAAAVWTRDMNVAHRTANALHAGTVWINTYDKGSFATPFGGFKQSGFGRDRSPHAIEKYTDLKTIWTAYR
ncbi:MAG: aldehyde dehydrogenase [Gammaproteobacteria bacterium]|nr:aldehyde dehydrogenase [Gammaproteobacteria bacterium]